MKCATCDFIWFSIVDYLINGNIEGTWLEKLKTNICMTVLDNSSGLYLNCSFGKKGYSYENWILKCNHSRKCSAKIKNCVDINVYSKSYI